MAKPRSEPETLPLDPRGNMPEAEALVPSEAVVMPSVDPERLLMLAVERGVPVETLERILALRERLKAERAEEAFFAALSAFQGECPIIAKSQLAKVDSPRGSYTYSYAPLEDIVVQVQPLLRKYGLSFTFDTEDEEQAKTTLCTVHHVGGHSQTKRFRVRLDENARMNSAQKDGSANTYGCRYAFRNSFGIMTAESDDDGALAGLKNGQSPTGGPSGFGAPPRRASASTPPPPAAAPSDDTPPEDALSAGKVMGVRARIHAALKRHGCDTDPNMELVEAELDRMAQEKRGRQKWQHLAWRNYEPLCEGMDKLVDALADTFQRPSPEPPPGSRARLVVTRRPSVRR